MTDNAADAGNVSLQKKRERNRVLAAIEDIRVVLATESGRNVLKAILEDSAMFDNSITVDHGTLAFREGRRYVGLRLLAIMSKAEPATVARMITESAVKKTGEGT